MPRAPLLIALCLLSLVIAHFLLSTTEEMIHKTYCHSYHLCPVRASCTELPSPASHGLCQGTSFVSYQLASVNVEEEIVNNIILNPQYAEFLALIKAARNGAVYGAKVRFPHALV